MSPKDGFAPGEHYEPTHSPKSMNLELKKKAVAVSFALFLILLIGLTLSSWVVRIRGAI